MGVLLGVYIVGGFHVLLLVAVICTPRKGR